jgi:hypothetical protein
MAAGAADRRDLSVAEGVVDLAIARLDQVLLTVVLGTAIAERVTGGAG